MQLFLTRRRLSLSMSLTLLIYLHLSFLPHFSAHMNSFLTCVLSHHTAISPALKNTLTNRPHTSSFFPCFSSLLLGISLPILVPA
ncbi:hypothetical protein FKM82_023843 [Ascaphus truei]